jgi:hypothetical protein
VGACLPFLSHIILPDALRKRMLVSAECLKLIQKFPYSWFVCNGTVSVIHIGENIKINLAEIGVDWIHVVQNQNQRCL